MNKRLKALVREQLQKIFDEKVKPYLQGLFDKFLSHIWKMVLDRAVPIGVTVLVGGSATVVVAETTPILPGPISSTVKAVKKIVVEDKTIPLEKFDRPKSLGLTCAGTIEPFVDFSGTTVNKHPSETYAVEFQSATGTIMIERLVLHNVVAPNIRFVNSIIASTTIDGLIGQSTLLPSSGTSTKHNFESSKLGYRAQANDADHLVLDGSNFDCRIGLVDLTGVRVHGGDIYINGVEINILDIKDVTVGDSISGDADFLLDSDNTVTAASYSNIDTSQEVIVE